MNEVDAHLQKAHEKLEAARDLLKGDHAEDSVSRAYYAAFHAAAAALVASGETPKTHKGMQQRFWVRFVENGPLPRHIGKAFARAQEMRGGADYDAFMHFETMAATDLLRDVEVFVQAVEALVHDLNKERR